MTPSDGEYEPVDARYRHRKAPRLHHFTAVARCPCWASRTL